MNRRVQVDGEVFFVPKKVKSVIERLVQQRDRAREEQRGARVRHLRWRVGPRQSERLQDFEAPAEMERFSENFEGDEEQNGIDDSGRTGGAGADAHGA
jgi:hypothetical protein